MTPSDYQDQEVKTPKVEVVDSYDTGDDGITDAARRYWLQFQSKRRLPWNAHLS